MKFEVMSTIVGFAACTSAAPTQPVQVEPEPVPVQVEAPAPVEVAPAPIVVEPIPLVFAPVVEGECPRLDVSLVDGEAFVHSSVGEYIARVLPDGALEDLSIDSSRFSGEPYYVTVGDIEAVEGEWPDKLYARYLQTDGRVWEGSRYLKRTPEGWWPLATTAEESRDWGAERMYRWTGGNWLARMSCRDIDGCKDRGMALRVIRGPGKAPKFNELRGVVEGCATSYTMTVLPGGEIVAVGRFCHEKVMAEEGGAYYAVRWSEPAGTSILRLNMTPESARAREPGPVVASSPTRVYAAVLGDGHSDPASVLAFDGAAWKELPLAPGEFGGLEVDRDGAPWLIAGGQLLRGGADGAWEKLAFPTGAVKQVGGLRDAVGWVAQVDGALWLRREGEQFARAELPAPAFSSDAKYDALAVKSAGRDVWVTASYVEEGPGWGKKERRRALLRNGPAREPQRCAQSPSYRPEKGMYAWPPAAREGCATAYAILIRASAWTREDYAYPALGKALRGKHEFAAASFSEVEVSGRRLVGAAVPDLAVGRALTAAIARAIKGSRPELVCAAPKQLRPLPFDLTTGKLAR